VYARDTGVVAMFSSQERLAIFMAAFPGRHDWRPCQVLGIAAVLAARLLREARDAGARLLVLDPAGPVHDLAEWLAGITAERGAATQMSTGRLWDVWRLDEQRDAN
jgi:hypothetical protein